MQEYEDYPISGNMESAVHRLQRTCCQYALGLHKVSVYAIVDTRYLILLLLVLSVCDQLSEASAILSSRILLQVKQGDFWNLMIKLMSGTC